MIFNVVIDRRERRSSGSHRGIELRVGSRYRLERKIGEGSFGVIYRGVDVTNGEPVGVNCKV